MENNSKKPSYTNADDFAVTSVPENKRKSILTLRLQAVPGLSHCRRL